MRHAANPWLSAAIVGLVGLVYNGVAGMLLGLLAGAMLGAVLRNVLQRAGWVRPEPEPGSVIATNEFRRMVSALKISGSGAWGIRWGAERNHVLQQLPPHLKADFSGSLSPALMRTENAEILGRRVAITLILKGEVFRELSFAPADPVEDPERALYGLYGRPKLRHPSPTGGSDAIWQRSGFAIDLNSSTGGYVSLIARSGTYP